MLIFSHSQKTFLLDRLENQLENISIFIVYSIIRQCLKGFFSVGLCLLPLFNVIELLVSSFLFLLHVWLLGLSESCRGCPRVSIIIAIGSQVWSLLATAIAVGS